MPRINVLDKQVAELIAAGEVIERPASVIKELVENSIDSGTTRITVEIKNGGVTYMRVTDNGCGIFPEDVPKAFLRHATSKIADASDLAAIATLGFRGEALASISAMCRVEMLTRTPGEPLGCRYVIEGMEELVNEEAGCPEGTTIIVRDIFYNTPVRMKFLKKDITEGNSVAAVLDKIALSHPEVSMRLIRDGADKLHTPGDGRLISAVYSVFGREFAEGLIPVSHNTGAVRVEGLVTVPTAARANRTMQSFFINGRYVRSGTCTAALEEAFRHSMMTGRYPGCVLNVILSEQVVDVNVHPNKLEVRFVQEKPVFDAVYYGVKSALGKHDALKAPREKEPVLNTGPIPVQQRFAAPDPVYTDTPKSAGTIHVDYGRSASGENMASRAAVGYSVQPRQFVFQPRSADLEVEEENGPPPERDESASLLWANEPPEPQGPRANPGPQEEKRRFAEARLIGELFGTYILLEDGQRLLLVDKHAAHERIIYERLREEQGEIDRQVLLEPVAVRLNSEEYGAVIPALALLEQLGIGAEDFGNGAVIVREIPVMLDREDAGVIIEEAARRMLAGRRDLTPTVMDDLLHSIACKSAIRAHDKSALPELAQLIRILSENEDIKYCPHGRPIAAVLDKGTIEKMFGRV